MDDEKICSDPDIEDDCVLPELLSAPSLRSRDQEALFLSTSNHLRMHRSAVRPFFCCGSELSLVSLPDQQELRPITKPPSSAQYDVETVSDESSGACAEVLLDNGRTCAYADGRVVRERAPRKKKMDGFPHKMSRKSWAVKLRGKLPKRLKTVEDHGNVAAAGPGFESGCTCTAYRQSEDNSSVYASHSSYGASSSENSAAALIPLPQGTETESLSEGKGAKNKGRSLKAKSQLHQVEDLEKLHRVKKARQLAEGGEAPQRASWAGRESDKLLGATGGIDLLCSSFQNQCTILNSSSVLPWRSSMSNTRRPIDQSSDSAEDECQYSDVPSLGARAPYIPLSAHTQVDYVHCLVPDLSCIANCSFYWGVMDRYEAEKLLENKPEGTFLLRDSAQEEFLFSVSFRRYGRSLHARVEQFQHKFSFDSHDPGVFATDTVCGLIEHYKDPSCCMFFEPMLTLPLNRTFPFSLQHLCRSTIASSTTYDGINQLPLPNSLKVYLKYYHYKHKVRVRQLVV